MNDLEQRLTPDSNFYARCPDGWTYYNGSCYTLVTEFTKSWADALLHCKNIREGSHLLTIDTAGEQTFLQNAVRQLTKSAGSGKFYWVGATDQEMEGTFVWHATGQLVSDTGAHWFPGQPDGNRVQNCACLWGNEKYTFHDWKCEASGYFICETSLMP